MVPAVHQSFVDRAVAILSADPRVAGVGAAGSWISGTMDEHSDVDLVVYVADEAYESVTKERFAIVASLGPHLVSFTGEHVGEPRVLISLFEPPLLHVDVKFVAVADLDRRVEDPVVLFEREGVLTRTMAKSRPQWPQPSWAWVEDRFWVWIHYGVGKVARGELFEALDCLSFLRGVALAPLAALAAGRNARGVRHLERDLPAFAERLRATIANYDASSILDGIVASVAAYRDLREQSAPADLVRRSEAERAAVEYLERIASRRPRASTTNT